MKLTDLADPIGLAMRHFAATLALLLLAASLRADDAKPPTEDDFYPLVNIPVPEGINLEAGGLAFMPDGKLAVSTRRGDIYTVENPLAEDVSKVKFAPYVIGLHEVLGLSYDDGWLYATQRGEVTRLKDENGDGKADLVETVNAGWEINGDYHEYAFGSDFDEDGNMWVVLCLTGSFNSNSKYRGWCVRITKDGKLIPTCSGIRSPGGIGMNAKNEVFYTDNQGPWNGTCGLKHLVPGSFQGHPGGNRWFELPAVKEVLGEAPIEPKSGSRYPVEEDRIEEYMPAAILFPYNKMGKSASGVTFDESDGAFGPFKGQCFVGDQSYSTVMRCYMEKVKGRYQGACFDFRAGFNSGTLPLEFSPDGKFLMAGGTNRGWGSRGKQPFALDRLSWTGKTPFEIHEMRAKPDGFELTFTEPVDPETAADPASYDLQTYTYIYQSSYGSPEVDHTKPMIKSAKVADDGKSVRLVVDGLVRGHVHELNAKGVRDKQHGWPLLHSTGYYTMNNIPEK